MLQIESIASVQGNTAQIGTQPLYFVRKKMKNEKNMQIVKQEKGAFCCTSTVQTEIDISIDKHKETL